MPAGNHSAAVKRPAPVKHSRPRVAQEAISLVAQPMAAPVQPLESVLNHVLGSGQVTNHHQRESHEFQMMFAKQGRDNVSGLLAVGPDHLTLAIDRLRRFPIHN